MKVTYKNGEQFFIADTLSRAYLTKTGDTQNDPVGKEEFSIQLDEINLVAEVPIAEERLKDLRHATLLTKHFRRFVIMLRMDRPYYSFRYELSCQQGLIFKFEELLFHNRCNKI